MFPERPRGPMPILPPRHYNPPPRKGRGTPQENTNINHLLSMFQNGDGQLDLEKLIGTAHQINGIYKQVRPIISKFMNR